MNQPDIGQLAPDFTLDTDADGPISLAAQKGKQTVLFFYPEDGTPGCTTEATEFSKSKPEFDRLGVVLVGISPNSVADHAKFRAKFGLDVILAADPEHIAIGAYGVWGPKIMAGHEYVGLIRTTFLVGKDGAIAGKWTVHRTKGHAAKVLDFIKSAK